MGTANQKCLLCAAQSDTPVSNLQKEPRWWAWTNLPVPAWGAQRANCVASYPLVAVLTSLSQLLLCRAIPTHLQRSRRLRDQSHSRTWKVVDCSARKHLCKAHAQCISDMAFLSSMLLHAETISPAAPSKPTMRCAHFISCPSVASSWQRSQGKRCPQQGKRSHLQELQRLVQPPEEFCMQVSSESSVVTDSRCGGKTLNQQTH